MNDDAKERCTCLDPRCPECDGTFTRRPSPPAPSGSLRAVADWALASVMSHDTAAKTARQLAAEVIRLEARVERLRFALDEAAGSLETASRCNAIEIEGWPGNDWYELRAWARNRALVARQALAPKQEDSPDGR